MYTYIGCWGSEGTSTPQPGDHFRFRLCMRACGRVGDHLNGCDSEVQISGKMRARHPSLFPFCHGSFSLFPLNWFL